jgi:choline dehydrogenase-like flavoprotein
MSANVHFKKPWARNKLYDIKYHYQNKAVSAHGTFISSQFALTRQVLEKEKLLNARAWFYSVFRGENTKGSEALIRMKQRLLKKEEAGNTASDLLAMIAHPVDTACFGLARLLQPRPLITEVKIQTIVEAEPNRDSRVTLSAQKDLLGMNRVKVDWQLTELVKRTFDRTVAHIAADLRRGGVADVTLDEPLEGRPWPAQLEGTWHHMGTTRMHDSEKQGVVDRNLKIHGMSNLYVAGSSVFPTVGANFPTITIAALTLRLASHLGRVIKGDDAAATLVTPPGLPVRSDAPVETRPMAASTMHVPGVALRMAKK